MPNPFPPVPQDKLATIAKFTGGLALLVLGAVYISGIGRSGGGALTASVVCSNGSCSDTINGSTLTISVNPGTVTPGSAATVTWSTTNITDLPASVSCFGSGGVNCTTYFQTIPSSYDTLGTGSFSVGGDTYLFAGTNAPSTTNGNTYLYKWIPSLNCFGKDTSSACGTVFQPLSGSVGSADYKTFTVGLNTYVAVLYKQNYVTLEGTYVSVYLWMPAGTPISNTTGCLGNGTTCSTALSTVSVSKLYTMDIFSIGSDTDLVVGAMGQSNSTVNIQLFKWVPSQQCFGNGVSTCSAFQQIRSESVDGTKVFTDSTGTYLAVDLYNPAQLSSNACDTLAGARRCIYKWMPAGTPISNTTGCFGDGSSCGTVLWKGNNANGEGSWFSVVKAGTDFVFGSYENVADSVWKWMPANTPTAAANPTGCEGNGSTCNSTIGSYGGTGSGAFSSLVVGLDTYIAFGLQNVAYLYKYMPAGTPASNTTGCLGNGTTCNTKVWSYSLASGSQAPAINLLYLGTTPYIVVGSYRLTGTVSIFKGVTSGTTPACSVQWSSASGSGTLATGDNNNTGVGTGPITQNTTYTLTCAGVGSVPITLYAANLPTVGISAPSSVVYGSSVNVSTTFSADTANGDVLTQTAIDGPAPTPVPGGYNWTLAPGLSWTPPVNQTYVFDPMASGLSAGSSYTFIPDVSTQYYSGWNHSNNQSVAISVTCPVGYTGSTCNQCASGYAFDNTSQCEPFSCFNSGACSCATGYTWNGSQCVVAAPSTASITSFSATRVRKGNAPMLSWTVTGMTSGMTCTITPAPPAGQPVWPGTSSWTGSAQGISINAATTFTLQCGSAASGYVTQSLTARIVPAFQEI